MPTQYTISAASVRAIEKEFTNLMVGMLQSTERAIDAEVNRKQTAGAKLDAKTIAVAEQEAVKAVVTDLQQAARSAQLALSQYSQKKLEQATAKAKAAAARAKAKAG